MYWNDRERLARIDGFRTFRSLQRAWIKIHYRLALLHRRCETLDTVLGRVLTRAETFVLTQASRSRENLAATAGLQV